VDLVATDAAMDEHPLAALANGDPDRLHEGTAVGCAVTRGVVDVTTPQAVRTVVPVRGAERVVGNVEPAVAAAERLGSSSIAATSMV
jgi:hypothetical protein